MLSAVILAGCIATGCTNPNAPSPMQTCATQPRTYILTDGTIRTEVDHYTAESCPNTPIK